MHEEQPGMHQPTGEQPTNPLVCPVFGPGGCQAMAIFRETLMALKLGQEEIKKGQEKIEGCLLGDLTDGNKVGLKTRVDRLERTVHGMVWVVGTLWIAAAGVMVIKLYEVFIHVGAATPK
jgi:hypothetical protein